MLIFFFKTVWVNDYCAAQVSNSSSCSILIHINNTKPKVISQNRSEAFCLCLLTDTSVSTDLQMQINSLPAGGAVGARNIAVSPGTAVIKSATTLTKTTSSGITGNTKWKWNQSAQFIQLSISWIIYLCRSVLILWRAATITQFMGNTGHCYKTNCHNLSVNKKIKKHISREMLPDHVKRHMLNRCQYNKCQEGNLACAFISHHLQKDIKNSTNDLQV